MDLRKVRRLLTATILLVGLMPGLTWACACGCGVFEVATPSLIPNGAGGTVWFEYDFMNQYINWRNSQPSSSGANSDKQIRTHFLTVGAQYMFNRNWGVMATVPYWIRLFRTQGDSGGIDQFNHANFGDVRIWGMYTGLQEDMSLGLLGGFKLPTGDHTYEHFDRDTSIGTGSTDLLLGAYKEGTFPSKVGNIKLTFRERPFSYYAQAGFDYPFLTTGNYVPGKEFDASVGAIYDFGKVGFLKELAPILSLLTSVRAHDMGAESAQPPGSGYERLLIAPGGEIRFSIFRLYSDIEFPIFQYMNGNQLTAPFLLKTIISYDF
ncbi:MAG TPA: hypothetical protein VGY99_03385 [Candidatus Binataceae bacterium]|nr:hypothetical protein [Candidatus Binataceae bacterium]